MQISEHLFPHLLADHDARLERELEQRRVALERIAEASVGDARPGPRVRVRLTRRRRGACAA